MSSETATQQDGPSREAILQQKYIELLEKRIAQLETVVNATPKTEPKPIEPKPIERTLTSMKFDDKGKDNTGQVKDEADIEKDQNKPDADKKGNESTRYRNILRKWDKNTGSHVDEAVGENFFLEQKVKGVAYTFRRVYDPEIGDKGAFSELDIEDPALIQALKSEIGKYPGVNFDGDMVAMSSPFAALVHNWDKLNERAAKDPESQTSKDLSSLLNRVKTAPELQNYFKIREANRRSNVVTFETLWTVFAPDTPIVARLFQNEAQILKVAEPPIPWSTDGTQTFHRMWAWMWDWDGKRMIKVEYELKFERFRGTRPITELPYYPLEYHENPEGLMEEARERAVMYLKATARCKPGAGQMFRYTGLAFADQRDIFSGQNSTIKNAPDDIEGQHWEEEDTPQSRQVQIKGEVIIDPDAFNQHSYGRPPLGEKISWEQIFIDELQTNTEEYLEFVELVTKLDLETPLDPENENFLVFPPRVLGYATREKVWGQFNLKLIKEPFEKQPDKFNDNLQLDPKYKRLIKALVQSHELSNTTMGTHVEDVVEEKGKGLVLLLHGPPGVGKTLTAETIAQATAKPLVVVSVAEIGLDASRAEKNLERLFSLATKWEAILLVDEADVFLETRGATSSASRNALVSVLLRVLEYYRGIIILTTNRIKSIDIAVISRIHLAIRYEDLSADQMRSIFKYFLDQLEPGCIADREQINDFIDSFGHHYGLNGRQIRNVVSAALAAARHEAAHPVKGKPVCDGRMTFKHLKEVCEMTRDFQEQLKENTRQQRYNNEVMR